jgi:anaerobic ribonucleoside-triphosphate reductase
MFFNKEVITMWCEICRRSISIDTKRTNGDITIEIGTCPTCGNKKVEKWRRVLSYIAKQPAKKETENETNPRDDKASIRISQTT